MRPVIIGVGGAYSGVGKTTVVCEILRRFENWGAIKYTKTPFYSSVTDDIAVLVEEGKDTKRFLDAGAVKVVWVQSPYSELPVTLPLATGMLSQVRGILVEGNSAVEVLQPDIVIFIAGDRKQFKESSGNILRMAHIVVFERELPFLVPKNAVTFRKDEEDAFMNSVLELICKRMTEQENSQGASGE
ncbi:MAG: hypothetical protein L6290_11725 [Thermodesulfovibrionales bacterium]|nr:hypothetical protein [Thermodesulfovibrionales bacterium]